MTARAPLMQGPDPRPALIEVARDFHARGWMSGSAGNLSARVGDDEFWVTASGRSKGRLTDEDFVRVALNEGLRFAAPGRRASAETSLHAAVYRLFPAAQACLHVHSVAACVASARAPRAGLRLPGLEMIKAFDIWDPSPVVDLPVFPNHAHVPDIAAALTASFATKPPPLSAFMIAGHGTTVWGASLEQAYNRVEALEFLLEYLERAG